MSRIIDVLAHFSVEVCQLIGRLVYIVEYRRCRNGGHCQADAEEER